GRRRERLLARFAALLQDSPDPHDLWTSQYSPIRSLYEQADTSTREKIRKAVAKCSDKAVRLHYQICLLPALAETERVALAPRLLQEIDSSVRPLMAGSSAEQLFGQLLVLFLHWPGDQRTKALLAMLRVGAHMSRRRWLYDLGEVPPVWPPHLQGRVRAPVLEAIRDAVRLWP